MKKVSKPEKPKSNFLLLRTPSLLGEVTKESLNKIRKVETKNQYIYYLLLLGLSSVTFSKVGNIGKIIRNLYTNRI